MNAHSNTAMAAAMTRAGVNTDESKLYGRALALLRSGWPMATAIDKLMVEVSSDKSMLRELCRGYMNDRADDLRGSKIRAPGLGTHVGTTIKALPGSPDQDESEDRVAGADEAYSAVPSLSDERSGGRPAGTSRQGRDFDAAPASRNPARGLSAIAAIQPAIARSIFQSMKLPDGRSLSEVQWHELPKLATEYRQHSRVLMLLYRKVTPPDTFATVDQVVHEQDVHEAIKQAETANDIF